MQVFRVQSTTAMQRANQRLSLTSLVYLFTKQSYKKKKSFLRKLFSILRFRMGLNQRPPD